MAKRKIRLLEGSIPSIKILCKDSTCLTQISFTSAFDQIAADAMGIKESIYQEDGQRRGGLREWKPELELFGATLTLAAAQKDLFTENGELPITSIKFEIEKLIRQKASEQLKLSFKITVPGIPRSLLDFVEILKKGMVSVVIEQPSKAEEAEAQQKAIDYGLFKEPKGESEEGEDGEETEEDEARSKSRGRKRTAAN